MIELLIPSRKRSLAPGTFVERVLPFAKRRTVGPFIFVDHFGPVMVPPGKGMDVGPHPHIGLATVTYLFAGRTLHRDSLGSVQLITPGDVNWMTAGRGIVHSERTPPEDRDRAHESHGIQTWVALPLAHEGAEPDFHHHPKATLPELELGGARVRLIAGEAYGERSPVKVYSPMIYAELTMPAGTSIPAPDQAERGVFVISGRIAVDGEPVSAGSLAVLASGDAVLSALEDSHAMILGGDPLDGTRLIWWNFVASDQARIDRAKRAWGEGTMAEIPGDGLRVPLPRE